MTTHRILHCLRAPVGGLFRHVRDLAINQAGIGHQVAVICDSNASDGLSEARLAELAPHLPLGLYRTGMSRNLGPADFSAYRAVRNLAARLDINVLHGHGAKGGAYARLAAAGHASGSRKITSVYTPHGGSLHYHPATVKGRIYMAAESHLARHTDVIIFESAYSSRIYAAQVGQAQCHSRIIPNGVQQQEFEPVEPAQGATDFVFIGELRHLKGVDVLLQALAILRRKSIRVSASIVGDGPDAQAFREFANDLGLDPFVSFPGAMPARQAFRLGRALVVPSRAESFPYIVLEAAAAGLPLFASNVGGIPEIVAGTDTLLLTPADAPALAQALCGFLADPAPDMRKTAQLQARIAENFTVAKMTEAVCAAYAAGAEPARQ